MNGPGARYTAPWGRRLGSRGVVGLGRRGLPAAIAAGLLLVWCPPAGAQQSVSGVLTFLMTNDSVQTGSPQRDRAAAQATSDTISRALLERIATLPVASSSSAFVYRLNPDLGTIERTTDTFGPFFVERALTAGRGRMSIGLAFQQMRFSSIDGRSLRDGSLVTVANQFTDERAPFDVDRLTLHIAASIATLYGNVGLTDRLDLGFAVPVVSLRLDGTRVNTYRGRAFTQANASATSAGLADVVVRGKYLLAGRRGSGVAAAADVRLPTGRPEDLLGTGSTSLKLSAVGSVQRGRMSSHVNGGVGLGGLAREIDYGAAVEVAATGRLTVLGELIGRRIAGLGSIAPVAAPNPAIAGAETIRLLPNGADVWTASLAPGVKWNVSSTWVVLANVTVPLTSGGLTAPIAPYLGVDYAFGP